MLTFGNYMNFVSDLRKYQLPGNTELINNNIPYLDKITWKETEKNRVLLSYENI